MRFETRASVATRGVRWTILAAGVLFSLALGMSLRWHNLPVPALVLLWSAVYAVLGAVRAAAASDKAARTVMADGRGLSIGGASFMTRDAIQNAYVVPTSDQRRAVHIEGRLLRRSCVVEVESEERALALLAALEIDPFGSTARFRSLPSWAKHFRVLTALVIGSPMLLINFIKYVPPWGVLAIMVGYGLVLLPVLLPQEVEVGHDGVFLKWLGSKRFIAFSEIASVVATRTGVELLLHGDRHVEIRLSQKDRGADAQVMGMTTRIKTGMAARANHAAVDEEALLAQQGRDLDTWLRDMRSIGAREIAGYRAAAIPREKLWAVVESPLADASAREGAALALAARLDADERVRLAAIAHKTAQPRLRIALEGVSREPDEARLRIALENAANEHEPDAPISEKLTAARRVAIDRQRRR